MCYFVWNAYIVHFFKILVERYLESIGFDKNMFFMSVITFWSKNNATITNLTLSMVCGKKLDLVSNLGIQHIKYLLFKIIREKNTKNENVNDIPVFDKTNISYTISKTIYMLTDDSSFEEWKNEFTCFFIFFYLYNASKYFKVWDIN